jgi:outer membrane protein assembly factor BamB
VDGDHVYVLGVLGDLVCLAKADGKPVWKKNLKADFGGQNPNRGYSESPLIDGDNLICTPGKGAGMVALNKKTGETVWECEDFADAAGYSSIVPTVVGDVRQYVQQTMESAVGVRAKDGKLLWRMVATSDQKPEPGARRQRIPFTRQTAVIPTPVVSDGYAFFTAGYTFGCECFKLVPDGDGTKAEPVYRKFRTVENHHGGVIAVGDYIYGHSDRGGWTCFAFKQAKDEPEWTSTKLGKGSIAYADGHFYCYSEGDGTLVRIKATPEGWREAGRFKIPQTSKTRPGSGRVWAHPVVAQDKLFLRDYEYLYCYDLKGQ